MTSGAVQELLKRAFAGLRTVNRRSIGLCGDDERIEHNRCDEFVHDDHNKEQIRDGPDDEFIDAIVRGMNLRRSQC
jgi:hypothetical protein